MLAPWLQEEASQAIPAQNAQRVRSVSKRMGPKPEKPRGCQKPPANLQPLHWNASQARAVEIVHAHTVPSRRWYPATASIANAAETNPNRAHDNAENHV